MIFLCFFNDLQGFFNGAARPRPGSPIRLPHCALKRLCAPPFAVELRTQNQPRSQIAWRTRLIANLILLGTAPAG
jgi:hypothetical protein